MMCFLLIAMFGFEVGTAQFEGDKLYFSEGVTGSHPLGTLKAKSLEATFLKGHWSELPHEITLKEGVLLSLTDNSEMSAPFATLDCIRWTGFFRGLEENKVNYVHALSGWKIKSLEMTLQAIPPKDNEPAEMDHLVAEGSVEIDGENGLHLEGEKVCFEDWQGQKRFAKATLYPRDLNSECIIEAPDLKARAETLALNLETQELFLAAPHGSIAKEDIPLHFKARGLKMDKNRGKMMLEPPISVEWGGHLELHGEAELTQKMENGKRSFAFFETTGPLKLTFKDSEFGLEHTLTASGKTVIDHQAMTISATSPHDSKNKVPEGEQIHFSDLYGDIFSDYMTITYKNEAGHLVPLKIFLQGNVRLLNKALGAEKYALADQAEFVFSSSELILKATDRARVLFYDEVNQIQASAPALVLKRDPQTGKDHIKGIGNVRFIFAEEEFNELKKRFSF